MPRVLSSIRCCFEPTTTAGARAVGSSKPTSISKRNDVMVIEFSPNYVRLRASCFSLSRRRAQNFIGPHHRGRGVCARPLFLHIESGDHARGSPGFSQGADVFEIRLGECALGVEHTQVVMDAFSICSQHNVVGFSRPWQDSNAIALSSLTRGRVFTECGGDPFSEIVFDATDLQLGVTDFGCRSGNLALVPIPNGERNAEVDRPVVGAVLVLADITGTHCDVGVWFDLFAFELQLSLRD